MRIAICDDQTDELEGISTLVTIWRQKRSFPVGCKTFHNTLDMLEAARKERFTLYLLDVIMPGMDGMSAAREIRSFDETADIVFLTNTPAFAYKSYDVKALAYLIKPIGESSLFAILDKLYLKEQKPQEGLVLKCGSTLVRVLFSQLSYVEVNHKRLYFHLTDGQVRETTAPLSDYKKILLTRREFVEIHRSYIVNMMQIEELSPKGIRTFLGKNLPVSRLLYPQIKQDYLKLLFEEERE